MEEFLTNNELFDDVYNDGEYIAYPEGETIFQTLFCSSTKLDHTTKKYVCLI